MFLELMHRECVYKLWASINRPDLGNGYFIHSETDISPATLSHKQLATYRQNLEILKDSIQSFTTFT